MAKEVKTLTVSTSEEAQTIRAYQSFGWELLSNQEIFSQDSHLEKRGSKIYSVTKTVNYVKLTFERDPSKINNFKEICKLEEKYHALPAPRKKPRFLKTMELVLILCFAGIFVLMGISVKSYEPFTVAAVIAIAAYLWQRFCQSRMPAWENSCQQYEAQCVKLFDQAEQLRIG